MPNTAARSAPYVSPTVRRIVPNPNYRPVYAAPTLAASAAARAAIGPRAYYRTNSGKRYFSGPVNVYGVGGYAGSYPSAAAAFTALSVTLPSGAVVYGGAAANGPLGYAVKAPLRGRVTGGAYTPGLNVLTPITRVSRAPGAPITASLPGTISAYRVKGKPITRIPAAITLFSVATANAARARRAAGIPKIYYRVRNKLRVAPATRGPAGLPRTAALGAPRLFSLAA